MTMLSKLVYSTQLNATRALSTSSPIANAATVVSNTTMQTPVDAKGKTWFEIVLLFFFSSSNSSNIWSFLFRTVQQLEADWRNNPRWNGIARDYSPEDVLKLRTSIRIEHSLARRGADRLWRMITKDEPYVPALGALTGNQAVQQVKGKMLR